MSAWAGQRWFATGLLLLVSAAGCDDLVPEGPSPDAGAGPDPADFNEVFCSAADACAASSGPLFQDAASCRAFLDQRTSCHVWDVTASGVRVARHLEYREGHASACLEALEEDGCELAVHAVPACAAALAERTDLFFVSAADEVCGYGRWTGCEPGLYCGERRHVLDCGLCRPHADQGAPCDPAAPESACTPALLCSAASQTCGPPPGRGEPCAPTGQCSGALICRDGQCADRGLIGEPCSTTPDSCVLGATCHQGSCTAVDWCATPTAGEPCVLNHCASGLYCSPVDHTCRTTLAEGAPCQTHVECGAATAYCGDGACVTYALTETPCGRSRACEPRELYCESGICRALLNNGEPCPSSFACLSLYCDAEGVCAVPICSGQ